MGAHRTHLPRWECGSIVDLDQIYEANRQATIGWVLRAIYLRGTLAKLPLWIATAAVAMTAAVCLLAGSSSPQAGAAMMLSIVFYVALVHHVAEQTFGRLRRRMPACARLGRACFEMERYCRFRVALRRQGGRLDGEQIDAAIRALQADVAPRRYKHTGFQLVVTLMFSAFVAFIATTVDAWPMSLVIAVVLLLIVLMGAALILQDIVPTWPARTARLEKFLLWLRAGNGHGGLG